MIIDMFAYDNHFIIRGSCSRMIIISSSGFMFAYGIFERGSRLLDFYVSAWELSIKVMT